MFKVLCKLKGKSLSTITFRGWQEARLSLMSACGGWPRLSKRIARHWDEKRVEKFIAAYEANGRRGVLVDPTAEDAFYEAFQKGLLDKESLISWGAAIRARRFDVLNWPVPSHGVWPWNTDWRFNHAWPLRDFRSFDHHEKRTKPYDVKFPWELSRLWFLPPLAQKAMLNRSLGWDRGHQDEVIEILRGFRAANPLGRSVNWYPMETSMRGINLVLLLDMFMLSRADARAVTVLLEMIAQHGECLWRSIEYTDNRGNHYAANIVALLLLGAALAGFYPPAMEWQLYAAEHMEAEILRQFLPDGVNFEMSTAYHALVAELFLLGALVLSRQKMPLGGEALRRLHEACHYAMSVRRPDGKAALVGDTDDARIFALDTSAARDHRSLLALGAVMFDDPELAADSKGVLLSPVVPWLFGMEGVRRFLHLTPRKKPIARHFVDGGVMAVSDKNTFLLMDAGLVGQNGVGGHGHNDMLSFEFFVQGQPLIIDPGCPTYTGDPSMRRLFRSTQWHNALVVDGKEMAEMTGPFRIDGSAKPHSVSFSQQDDGRYKLAAGHTGYHRLPDPVDVYREMVFDLSTGSLECTDKLTSKSVHKVERYLHFAPDVTLQERGGQERGGIVFVSIDQHRYQIEFDAGAQPHVILGRVSSGYGDVAEAPILVLTNTIEGDAALIFRIVRV